MTSSINYILNFKNPGLLTNHINYVNLHLITYDIRFKLIKKFLYINRDVFVLSLFGWIFSVGYMVYFFFSL